MLGGLMVGMLAATMTIDDVTAPTGPHTWKVAGNGNFIIDFDPAKSSQIAAPCEEIGHLQFLQMWAVRDNGWTLIKPGQLRARDAWLDPTMSDAGHVLDTINGSDRGADPIHQDRAERGDTSHGKHAVLYDAPRVWETDLPAYHPERSPDGWKQLVWRFQTYAYCAIGADRGRWYEGVAWTFEVYPEQMATSGFGALAFVAELAPPIADPDASVRQALARYLASPRHASRGG